MHPATTHYPIAFRSAASIIDMVYGLATYPATAGRVIKLYNVTPFLGTMALMSYYLNLLGLIATIPTVVTGVVELLNMVGRQDLIGKLENSKDKRSTLARMHPKLKVAFFHAALSDVAALASGYMWWARRDAVMFAPSGSDVIFSVVSLWLLFFSANLGAMLVYDHGVGVRRKAVGRSPMDRDIDKSD